MNERDVLKKLADAAAVDPPAVDVSWRVMRDVRRMKVRAVDRTVGYFAAAASAVAAMVTIAAIYSWQNMNDPLMALVGSAGTLLQ